MYNRHFGVSFPNGPWELNPEVSTGSEFGQWKCYVIVIDAVGFISKSAWGYKLLLKILFSNTMVFMLLWWYVSCLGVKIAVENRQAKITA